MKPSNAILDAIVTLLADDTATLAAVAAMHLHLAKAPFTPGPDLDLASLVEADFQGYAALDAGTGNQTVFYDPLAGLRTIDIKEPAGGWHWQSTGLTNVPQTIYGYYLTNNANTVLYGSSLLDNQTTITASGQGLDIGFARFAFLPNSPQ